MINSIEERQAISRRNGAKSKGPKSPETRRKASRNSIKHGFYAVVHNLPDEDPAEVGALRERWFTDVGPRNVAEEFFTEQCFRAHLQGNRVERARHARLTQQMDKATAPWHDARDAAVSTLWNGLVGCEDAREILDQLGQTTVGLRALADEWGQLREGLQEQGYWSRQQLSAVTCLSGCPSFPNVLMENEDAYRLTLWNERCTPEPDGELIKAMLEPTCRPPALRDVDRDVLLPSPVECLARLKQWADDVIAELNEEWERVWREVEAPALARRTDPQTLVRDAYEEARLHRATNEYQALFYKAHNALEAIRKREAAEAKEARKSAEREDARGSDGNEGRSGRAGRDKSAGTTVVAAAAPAVAPTVAEPVATPGESPPPVAPSHVVDVQKEAEAGARNEPGSVTENREAGARNEPGSVTESREASARNEPGSVTESREASARNEPGTLTNPLSDTAVVEQSTTPATSPAGAVGRSDPPAPADVKPRQPRGLPTDSEPGPAVTEPPGGSAESEESVPYGPDPATPWEAVSPPGRLAIEGLSGQTMAVDTARL